VANSKHYGTQQLKAITETNGEHLERKEKSLESQAVMITSKNIVAAVQKVCGGALARAQMISCRGFEL